MIARLIISKSPSKINQQIDKILSEAGLKNPHPDLLFFPSDSKLGIGEAKKVLEHLSTKAYQAKGKGVVLEDSSKLTPEAQNSLLKIFEEPPQEAVIILAASSDTNFLPTLLSRCEIIYLNEPDEKITNHEEVKKLLQGSIEQRFEYIEKCKEKEELLNSLVDYFHQNLASNSSNAKLGKELLQAEEWASRNVNIRAILEYLMLVIPEPFVIN